MDRSLLPIIYINLTSFTSKAQPFNQTIIDAYVQHQELNPVIIFDSLGEAPGAEYLPFVDQLRNIYPNIKLIHITSGVDPEKEKYHVITDHSLFFWPLNELWPQAFSNTATHHFISLCRVPKPHRIRWTNTMLDRGLDKHGYFSMGSVQEFPYDYVGVGRELGISDENLKYFPSYLDGPCSYNLNSQYGLVDPRITNALLNVVLETSYEKLTNLAIDEHLWRVPFVTEKTAKAFAVGQIPIILGPLNQVAITRNLGFDLFDDIIDHSYDQEVDPILRIEKFANSVEEFINKYPQDQLQSLKDQLMPRFRKNLDLARHQHQSSKDRELTNLLEML